MWSLHNKPLALSSTIAATASGLRVYKFRRLHIRSLYPYDYYLTPRHTIVHS